MYKVFYNDRTVFFSDQDFKSAEPSYSKIHYYQGSENLKIIIDSFLETSELKSLYILNPDVETIFKKFTKDFKMIEAAGGLVKNKLGEILVIFRKEKWDLPKGKLEKKELPEIGSVREVEEECGISNLKIIKLIDITYHTYTLKNKDILKKTYWFEMFHPENQIPKPQIEEEITEAKWIDPKNIDAVINNTYLSIIEVLMKGNIIQ